MGLEVLEFTLAVEEAFNVRFPNEDMPAIKTPRKLVDYLAAHLPLSDSDYCLSQRAFYRLRYFFSARIECQRSEIRPDTSLTGLVRAEEAKSVWEAVRRDMGATTAKRWPRLADQGWFDLFRPPSITTLREAVSLVANYHPLLLKSSGDGWTRNQVTAVVHGLMGCEFGINTNHEEYDEDLTWNELGFY